MARSSLMILLKKFRCSNTVVTSIMRSPYSYFLRYSLLEKLFAIYNVSNLDHNPVTVSSSITLYIILSAGHSWIVLAAFRSISSQSSFDVPAGVLTYPARSCEDLVASATPSPSFVISRSFFTIELLDLEFCHKTSCLRHIALRQLIEVLPAQKYRISELL